ncbi:MAG: arylamine N-acetyltransferase [Polyangiaceae bacterium]|nr:arylamine N-acetyltransferase [Polyangiaceae bacterium]
MDIDAYLQRIVYTGPLTPSIEVLRQLQLCHLYTVPFENLSIHANEPIILEEPALFNKIVERRRGGFCYELNGLFAALLRRLGFEVTLLSAGVASPGGEFGPPFDHMALMVHLHERYLVDVGFGDSFREPLLVDRRGSQVEGTRHYQITEAGESLVLMAKEGDADWKPEYQFTLAPHEMAEYTEMCHYHQTSPNSPFTKRRICSKALPNGRVTLSNTRFIETQGTERRERDLANDGEVQMVLENEFGIFMNA